MLSFFLFIVFKVFKDVKVFKDFKFHLFTFSPFYLSLKAQGHIRFLPMGYIAAISILRELYLELFRASLWLVLHIRSMLV